MTTLLQYIGLFLLVAAVSAIVSAAFVLLVMQFVIGGQGRIPASRRNRTTVDRK